MLVLVTGGAGFIGSALVDRLLAEGHHVDVVDDLSTGNLANLGAARDQVRIEGTAALKIHNTDVRDAAVTELVARREPDVVIHLAGATAKAHRDPASQAELDVVGTVRVLEGVRLAGRGHVVCVAAARAQADEIRGIPARAVHEYLTAYAEHGVDATTVVLPTVYGPRQTTATESSVVAVFVARALAGQACVIHGDGTQSRDLLYVDDAVDALARAMEHGSGVTVEVGTGLQTSVRDLHAAVARAAGVSVSAVEGKRRVGDPDAVAVDPRSATTLLGWESWTPLASGLRSTVAAARVLSDEGRT